MKIGLISDTHDNIENILKAVTAFKDENVDVVLHAGDYVFPKSVESFAGVKLIGVLGNNDTDVSGLSESFDKIQGELKGEIFEPIYDGIKFAVYHGTSSSRRDLLAKSGNYDVFIHGHTHRKVVNYIGKTLVINPGTANGWLFGLNATAAVFDTTTKKIDFINL
jgi:putative phosphoesterase